MYVTVFRVWGMHFWYLCALFAMKDWYIHNVWFFIFELWLLFNVVMDITKWCSGVIGVWKKYNQLERKKVSDIFRNYVHNVVMDITEWWFVVICYRIIRGYASNCFMVWGRHFLVFMCPFLLWKIDIYITSVLFYFWVMITSTLLWI